MYNNKSQNVDKINISKVILVNFKQYIGHLEQLRTQTN